MILLILIFILLLEFNYELNRLYIDIKFFILFTRLKVKHDIKIFILECQLEYQKAMLEQLKKLAK